MSKVPTKSVAENKLPNTASSDRPAARKWSAGGFLFLGLLSLAILVGGFGSWAAFSQISGSIISSGRIEVDQNRQVVQHPDGGIVREILVEEGDLVEAGDPLIRLDTTLLQSRMTAARSQLDELLARRARLAAERDRADDLNFDPDLLERAEDDPSLAELIEGQRNLFGARNETVEANVEQLTGRKEQIRRQIEGIEAQRAALETQVELIGEELEGQQSLLDRGLAQASRVLQLRREAARLEGQIGDLVAQAAEAGERLSEIDSQILSLTVERREEAITEMRDLSFRRAEYADTEASVREQLTRTVIRAPVGGVIYDMSVFAEQSVIQAAEPLLYIVPQDRPLVIATRVQPIHIDQVHVGQDARVRFPTFDARTTPELFGRVTQVSADAFQDEATGQSFYRAEIELLEGEMDRMPDNVVLIPGMPVEAYMRTADRSPIAYLVKPLADYFNRAFRES